MSRRTWFLVVALLGCGSRLLAETDLEKASRLLKTRAYGEAQPLLERLVQGDNGNTEALHLLGRLHLATRNPKKAQACAEQALKLQPNQARFHLLRGNALGMQAQEGGMLTGMRLVGDIRECFEKAVALDPKFREGRIAMFNFYVNVPTIAGGSRDKAQAFADQTLAVDPALGHYLRGALMQKKDPGNAQAEFRKAIAADPSYAPVYNAIGYVELGMKQVDQAVEHFQKQVQLAPDNPNAHDSLGEGWQAKGRLDEAAKAFRRALELQPTFWASARNLGKVLEAAGKRDEAITHYRRYAQLGQQQGMPQVAKEARERLKGLGAAE